MVTVAAVQATPMFHLAPTWDNNDSWVSTLRHIAKEGRQFVIGVAPLLRGSDVPEELRRAVRA